MYIFKVLFDFCFNIMKIQLTLFGYTISLYNVLAYGVIGFILLYILFRITR